MSVALLPALSQEIGFSRYLQEIKRFPMLEGEEEYMLAKRWIEHNDLNAAHRLVTSHLKLVAKIAMSFRGYGLPLMELVAEGNIGLMQAVKRFNPELGYRLSTYAMWWIKATIQEFVLRSWSLVKMGTTAAQKRLFFNLGKIKRRIYHLEARDLQDKDIPLIANQLQVTENEVLEMNQRMRGSGDCSLNDRFSEDGTEEVIDFLPETRANQEIMLLESEEQKKRKQLFVQALEILSEREQDILKQRRLQEVPTTLEDLSQKYGISRERIRQIEVRAFEKLQEWMLAADKDYKSHAA